MAPRISAASVEKHVEQQTQKLLDTASALFQRQGFHNTDMADIANAMDLARSSLYRYYPNKEHILLACIERSMAPLLECFAELQLTIDDPAERISAWLDLQLEAAASPAHATMQMMNDVSAAGPELQARVLELHQLPARVLQTSLAELPAIAGRDIAVLTTLIMGMVHSAAKLAIETDNTPAIHQELRHSVAATLGISKLSINTRN